MSEIIPGYGKTAEEILSSLTPREVRVLQERFGILLETNVEEEPRPKTAFLPSSGNNGGQGGAPIIATAPAPSSQDKEQSSSGDNSPKYKKH